MSTCVDSNPADYVDSCLRSPVQLPLPDALASTGADWSVLINVGLVLFVTGLLIVGYVVQRWVIREYQAAQRDDVSQWPYREKTGDEDPLEGNRYDLVKDEAY